MDKTAVYTAPTGSYILHAKQVIHSINGPGSSSVTTTQPNSSLVSLEEARRTFENERNYVLNLNIPDVIKAELKAKIDERQATFERRYFELASSHSAVVHTAMVRGQGKFSFKGRSSYEGSITLTLVQSAPEFEEIAAFRQKAQVDFRSLLQQKNIRVSNSVRTNPGVSGPVKVGRTNRPIGKTVKKNNH
ncbi:MAG TPA: hypothetical protein VJ953_06720 [Saprospiraceae bacterium]|nr:hypothetical protein [Saprospiraceae bacterium]